MRCSCPLRACFVEIFVPFKSSALSLGNFSLRCWVSAHMLEQKSFKFKWVVDLRSVEPQGSSAKDPWSLQRAPATLQAASAPEPGTRGPADIPTSFLPSLLHPLRLIQLELDQLTWHRAHGMTCASPCFPASGIRIFLIPCIIPRTESVMRPVQRCRSDARCITGIPTNWHTTRILKLDIRIHEKWHS